MKPLLVCLLMTAPLVAGEAAYIGAQLRRAELDPPETYRLRDIAFTRDDLKLYFTDGWLVFGKPVAGRIISAVFVTNDTVGDAELLVLPPTAGERTSLASFTKSPNLNEHFDGALLLFTDNAAEELKKAIESRGEVDKSIERGLLLARTWNGVLSNLATSFSTRLVQHLLAGARPERGFFFAALQGRTLGNFDVFYDPTAREQIYVGQLKYKEDRAYFDTWSSFQARRFRTG